MMLRKTTISVLLLIAAAILAMALFIAGAIWRGRMSRKQARMPAFSPLAQVITEKPRCRLVQSETGCTEATRAGGRANLARPGVLSAIASASIFRGNFGKGVFQQPRLFSPTIQPQLTNMGSPARGRLSLPT
jgi:hypothetical protein